MIKSQDDLNKPETHSTEVLLSTLEELEKVKKERDTYYKALMQIQYKTPALGGGTADMQTALCQIDNICDWALRPDEMKIMEEIEELRRVTKLYARAKWWLNEIVSNHRFTPVSTAEMAIKDLNKRCSQADIKEIFLRRLKSSENQQASATERSLEEKQQQCIILMMIQRT